MSPAVFSSHSPQWPPTHSQFSALRPSPLVMSPTLEKNVTAMCQLIFRDQTPLFSFLEEKVFLFHKRVIHLPSRPSASPLRSGPTSFSLLSTEPSPFPSHCPLLFLWLNSPPSQGQNQTKRILLFFTYCLASPSNCTALRSFFFSHKSMKPLWESTTRAGGYFSPTLHPTI